MYTWLSVGGLRNFLLLATVLLALPTAAAAAPSGALVQGSCQGGPGSGCPAARGLDGAQSVAVSADGGFVYVASKTGDSVAVFTRNPSNGALAQPQGPGGCIARVILGCQLGRGLDGPDALTLSPGGGNAYVASEVGDTLAVLSRDPGTGALQNLGGQAACVGHAPDFDMGPDTGAENCPASPALDQPEAVVVSPDGANVYVASARSDAVSVFSREESDGSVSQLGGRAACRSRNTGPARRLCQAGTGLKGAEAMAISLDGKHLYVSSLYDDAIAEFVVDPADGSLTHTPGKCVAESPAGEVDSCLDARGIDHPEDIAMSPDGKHVYAAAFASDSVAVLSRDAGTGDLSQPAGSSACVSETGSDGQCADGNGLDGAESVTVSPDGAYVYVGAVFSNAVATFSRDPATGTLTQLSGFDGCISNGGAFGCRAGSAMSGANAVTVAPGGAHAYASAENSDAVVAFARVAETSPLLDTRSPFVSPNAVRPSVADVLAPKLAGLKLTPSAFRPAGGPSIARSERGARVTYSLSEPSTVTFAVQRATAGRRVKGKCRRPTRSNRRAKRCTRFVKLKGSFRHAGKAGKNGFGFTGRLRGALLKPGLQRLEAVARDGAGNKSKPARKRFRITRPKR